MKFELLSLALRRFQNEKSTKIESFLLAGDVRRFFSIIMHD